MERIAHKKNILFVENRNATRCISINNVVAHLNKTRFEETQPILRLERPRYITRTCLP